MKRIATKVCTVVFSVAALAGCDWFRGPQNPATPVQTIHPKHGEIVRRVTLPGNVTAYQEATLYAKVAGYLKTINVDKGDSVKEGDTLAEIEAPEMLADLVKARAEAEAAQLDYKRVTEAQKKASDLVMPQTVDGVRAKSGIAVAGVQRVETLLSYAKLTAPFSGVITKRWVDPGALIPAEALVTEKNKNSVFVVRDKKALKVALTTGFDDGVNVEILKGCGPGDAVIVAGKQSVTDGQRVQATESK